MMQKRISNQKPHPETEQVLPDCPNSIASLFEVSGNPDTDSHWGSYLPDNPDYAELSEARASPPPSTFLRARRAGCLLPDPLTEEGYYTIIHRGETAKLLRVWTSICNYLVDIRAFRILQQLRLVNYQSSLIASHALRRRAGVSFVERRQRETKKPVDRTVFLGVPRTLPPLPTAYPLKASDTYCYTRLELIPEKSVDGRTVLLFDIQDEIKVGSDQDYQHVSGYVVNVTTVHDHLKSNKLKSYQQMIGRAFEARIYDPMYIDFEQQPEGLSSNCHDWPITVRNDSRRDSSHNNFYSEVIPMETLSKLQIKSQASPLVNRPQIFRLFHPSRELVDERGCAVMLLNEMTGGDPVAEVAYWGPDIQIQVATNIMNSYRAILEKRIIFDNYLTSLRVRFHDGSIYLRNWEGFYVDTDNTAEEWANYTCESLEGLRIDLRKLGLEAAESERRDIG
jgi:hypothetical protein